MEIEKDWTWYEFGITLLLAASTIAFNASAISHCFATWTSRGDFLVAVRSPLLGSMSGAVSVIVSSILVIQYGFFPPVVKGELGATWLNVLLNLLTFSCFTCAYGWRGFRLLVMYNPRMRERWGKIIKERAIAKSLLVLLAAIAIITCSPQLVLEESGSIATTASFVAFTVESLFTLVMCIALFGKLRRTKDMFDISKEVQRVGCATAIVVVLATLTRALPAWLQRNYVQSITMFKCFTPLWFTNMQPIRAVWRNRPGCSLEGIYLVFPFIPGRSSGRVAIEASHHRTSAMTDVRSFRSSVVDDGLGDILTIPPLLKAFEDFCNKALCSESIQFLIAATEFQARCLSPEIDEETPFDTLVGIVDKFIRDNSPFEVNIDGTTKRSIIGAVNAETFGELSSNDKARILHRAVKEVSKMLRENLMHKFRATEQYQQITGMLFSPPSEKGRSGAIRTTSSVD